MVGLSDLVSRLDEVVADLDELAFERLRQASADGVTQRSTDDRELVKARRAVEKAAQVLRRLDDGAGDGFS